MTVAIAVCAITGNNKPVQNTNHFLTNKQNSLNCILVLLNAFHEEGFYCREIRTQFCI